MRTSLKHILSVLIPAALIFIVSVYAFTSQSDTSQSTHYMPGKALASYDFYPVRSNENGALFLDKKRFMDAVHYLSENPSPKAISDLIYIGQANNIGLMLDDREKAEYKKILDLPDYKNLPDADQQKDAIFQVYRDIVNGFGMTFSGTGIEIVLHDTRNPLHSVVAIQNPISGRRLGDSTTNFGIELIKNYSVVDRRGSNFISYPLQLKDGRAVKSSTIPLFDKTYGLVGFICLNIDISKLDVGNEAFISAFISNFEATKENKKISEMLENSTQAN